MLPSPRNRINSYLSFSFRFPPAGDPKAISGDAAKVLDDIGEHDNGAKRLKVAYCDLFINQKKILRDSRLSLAHKMYTKLHRFEFNREL